MQSSGTLPVLIEDTPERLQSLFANIQTEISSWRSLSFSDVSFSRLTGFTNITYRVKILDPDTKTEVEPKIMVYREFCPHENFFSRKEEGLIFACLGKEGIGPRSYGGNDVYRLEEFIIGKHPDPEVMNSRLFALSLCKYAANFHNEDLEGLSKNPHCLYLDQGRPYPDFFKMTEKFKTRVSESDVELILTLRDFVNDSELDFLKNKLQEVNGKVCFCHNDLNANNIFLKDTGIDLQNSIIFIDFEYCNYNYRGYDMGNFLIERCFDYNYDKPPYFSFAFENFAEDSFIKEFAMFYMFFDLIHSKKLHFDTKIFELNAEKLSEILISNQCVKNSEEFEKEIEKMTQEIKIGVLMSLFYWILWSGSICQDPNIKFEYLKHGITRMETYLKLKKKWFEELKN